jgi:hypothetical protein
MVDTGGDRATRPHGRVSEKPGYTLLPGARYFKAM